MAWFLRAVEGEDGTWFCRRGLTVLDQHASASEAVEHLRGVAEQDGPAIVVMHWNDGRIEHFE